ncbi:MAG: GNAT family N-acetyltransferase [Flavobacterium sp.]|nr:GNAT family N-acetyltransferase [Pedobacter sp.]
MIRFATTEEVLPLRSSVLRNGKPFEECKLSGDDEDDSFHLAETLHNELVCVATFHVRQYPAFAGKAFQLRGMATSPLYRGKGIGKQVLTFGINSIRNKQANYLWCNARKAAYSFYLSVGFDFISDEFKMPDIGLHRTMYLRIN